MSDLTMEEQMQPVECTEPEAIPEPSTPHKKRRFVPYLVLAILFAVGLTAFFCIPRVAPVVSDPEMPWFSVQGGVLQYDASLYTGSEELTVPETVAGQTVTSIGGACFAGDTRITTVTLPDTILSIGESAFADCTALRGVFIPESVTKIGAHAFRGCLSLESVCIPYSVKTIESGAFENCPKLVHIFYTGPHASWATLYVEPINNDTKVYTANGTVNQKDVAAAATN